MFTQRLKRLRAEKKDLACVLGVSTSAYGFYEQGKREPDIDMLQKLSVYFDVSTDYLLGHTNLPQTSSMAADEMQLLTHYHNMQQAQKEALQKSPRASIRICHYKVPCLKNKLYIFSPSPVLFLRCCSKSQIFATKLPNFIEMNC